MGADDSRFSLRLPWSSRAVPDWTLAEPGALTPGGLPAVFRSSPHAWLAIRLVYLAECTDEVADAIDDREAAYRAAWDRYVRHGTEMADLAALIDDDLHGAATLWNAIDQREVDWAFTTVVGEREPYPLNNLAIVAVKRFDLFESQSVSAEERDRPLRSADNETAWQQACGVCRGCGTLTVSQRKYDRMRRTFRDHPDLFDLTPTYTQVNGKEAPLWSSRVLIAAKGVADHLIPWSKGGRTAPNNLANTCAACNYSRNNSSLDTVRVARYA